MKKIAKKIIKTGVFILFSFIFLNIYFPLASSSSAPKREKLVYSCQGNNDAPSHNNCQIEIMSN